MPMVNIHQLDHSPGLRQQISANLGEFDHAVQDESGLKAASVALTIFNHEGQAALIATRRTPRLSSHSGQWALPGGRIDAGENVIQAALRELDEEVSLKLPETQVLGRLDDYTTRSGYIISPIVVWSDCRLEDLAANPDEVASIHAFSFSELLRTDSPNLESIPESDRQVLSMNFLDDCIYAPTGAILLQFREVCLRGQATRVAHFDGPVFTWS